MAEGSGLSYYYRVAVVLLTTPMAIAYGKVLNIFVLTTFFYKIMYDFVLFTIIFIYL